jgi:hypothetical protein
MNMQKPLEILTQMLLFYDKARGLRDEIARKYPEIVDQEVLAQGKLAAGGLGRDSLPDTILAVATKETQEKLLRDIISKNRNIIFDNNAVARIPEKDVLDRANCTSRIRCRFVSKT